MRRADKTPRSLSPVRSLGLSALCARLAASRSVLMLPRRGPPSCLMSCLISIAVPDSDYSAWILAHRGLSFNED